MSDGNEVRHQAAEALKLVPCGQPLGTELFDEIAARVPSISFEGVLFRRGDVGLEVYLTRRDESDGSYVGQWHCPGTIFRSSDWTGEFDVPDNEAVCKSAAKRLSKEFGAEIVKFEEAGWFFVVGERGPFECKVFLVQLDGEPINSKGLWCSIANLPTNLVKAHYKVIELATKKRQSH